MSSEIVNSTVLDFHFKLRDIDTLFYIGDIYIGQIWHIRNKWTCLSKYPTKYGSIGGFRTRLDAAEYLLQVFRVEFNEET